MGSDKSNKVFIVVLLVFIQLAKPGDAKLSEKLAHNNTESEGTREEKCKLILFLDSIYFIIND
jgi:hypothetical protein